jgi:anti-sigma factor RsiW
MNQPDPNIDELLNSFIDGELTDTQRAEVERLIAYNAQIAQRLRLFQKTKILVNSLPHLKAPPEIIEQVKASLAAGTQPAEPPFLLSPESRGVERKGMRQLLARRVFAVAAMIALVAILAGVVYTIIAPETIPERSAEELVAIRPTLSVTAGAGFSGRLVLKAGVLAAVDGFINAAVEDNGLSDCVTITRQPNQRLYSLSCSRHGLHSLLVDLDSVWQKFDSATLFVDTEQFGAPVVVDTVTAEQIAEIADQDSAKKSIEVAEDFAILNNMAERMPAGNILAAMDDGKVNLITPPKPRFTGKMPKKTQGDQQEKREVSLTIVVVGSE